MDYLRSAPKSPQQGGTGPPRPPHFYNYAQRNNQNPPNPNPMQFQARPHPSNNARALPEDATIEQIEQSQTKSSSLLTILLVSITCVVILGGLGIGGYFAFRHKSRQVPKAIQQTIEESSPSEPSDSAESALPEPNESKDHHQESSEKKATDSKTTVSEIVVHQIFFQDMQIDRSYLGCVSHPFAYNKLSTLDGIAVALQEYTWNKEFLVIRPSLCDYFEETLEKIDTKFVTTNSIPICKHLQLLEDPDKWLRFIILSNKKEHQYPNQRGKVLDIYMIVFEETNKRGLYVMDNAALQSLIRREKSSQKRRRLVETQLPAMAFVFKNRDLWKPLPDGYRGTTIADLQRAMADQAGARDTHLQLGSADTSGLDGSVAEVHYELSPHADPVAARKLEDPQQWVEEQRRSGCDSQRLGHLFFISMSFDIKIHIGRHEEKGHWLHCQYTLRSQVTDDKIFLTKQWWHQVLKNPNTICTREVVDADAYHHHQHHYYVGHSICGFLDEYIRTSESGETESEDREDCACFRGCRDGAVWKAIDDGTRLERMDCAADIAAVHFVSQIDSHSLHARLPHGLYKYDYRVENGVIHAHDVPFWACLLIAEKEESGEGEAYRRRLLDNEHESGALNQDNMYMIIGSTIFCVVVGLQSFYWLSHSY
eukprot:59147_1